MFRLGTYQKFILTIFAISCILLTLLLIQLNQSTTSTSTQSNVSPIDFPTPTGNNDVCYVPRREGSGALSPLVTPIPDSANVMHNVGNICFSRVSPTHLQAEVGSAGCFSSSCSIVYARDANMKIDVEAQHIAFTSYFAVENYYPTGPDGSSCACTADCGGAGMMLFDIGELQEGTYSILLGEKQVGEIQIPFISASSSVCFSTE